MTLLYADSFDHGTDLTNKGWTGNAISLNGSVGRFVGCLTTASDIENGANAYHSFTPSNTIIVGFAHLFTTDPSFGFALVRLDEGTTARMTLVVNNDKSLTVTGWGTSAANLFRTNVYHYVEIKTTLSTTVGTVRIYIDGTELCNVTGLNLGSNGNYSRIHFWGTDSDIGGRAGRVDDLYICDTNGSVNNDFLGDVRIQAIMPTGAGNTTNFTPSAGSNWENVDEYTQDGDTTYNYTATTNNKDTFVYGNLTPTSGAIKAVQTVLFARKDDAGTRKIAPVIRHGTTDYDGTSVSVAGGYSYYTQIYETNPGTSAAWTISDVNNAEFGYKVTV